jgi:hypothetical protein
VCLYAEAAPAKYVTRMKREHVPGGEVLLEHLLDPRPAGTPFEPPDGCRTAAPSLHAYEVKSSAHAGWPRHAGRAPTAADRLSVLAS